MLYFNRRRSWLFSLIFVVAIAILTILTTPTQDVKNHGSTYSRTPQGYGAWYAYMQGQGTPIRRLQKPVKLLINEESSPSTLIRVMPQLIWKETIDTSLQKWVEEGNTLILLGVYESATDAAFSSVVESKIGSITIDTRRRNQNEGKNGTLLNDDFGAIIWSKKIGQGQIIYSTAPYLAANAYQDYPSNYKLLSSLVTESKSTVWIDEYIHGYRDPEILLKEIGGNVWSYLKKTPLLTLFIQGIILLGLAIWAGNHRLGRATPLASPTINNSEAYIQGLAAVLQKADCSEFVVSLISQAEKQEIQKILGLNDTSLTEQHLLKIVGQKSETAKDFKNLLRLSPKSHPMKDKELLAWLVKWRKIRTQLTKNL
jgi:hypothetical protein